MKLLLLIISSTCFLFNHQSFSQEEAKTYEIDFGDVKKIFTIVYDDPSRLPQFQTEIRFFNPIIMGDGIMAFAIKPIYHLDENMWMDMDISIPYAKGADGTIHHSKTDREEFKAFLDINPQFHYTLLKKIRVKEKKVNIDYEYSGNSTKIYQAKLPRKNSRTLELDGGINFQRRSADITLESLDTVAKDISYFIGSCSNLSLTVGLSTQNIQSVKYITDGKEYGYWRRGRIYGYLTYSLTNNYTSYQSIYQYDSNGSIIDPKISNSQSGFVAPKFSRLGYRVGLEKTLGMKNKGSGMIIGCEFGLFPYYYIPGNDSPYSTMESSFFTFKWGFVLGKKPL